MLPMALPRQAFVPCYLNVAPLSFECFECLVGNIQIQSSTRRQGARCATLREAPTGLQRPFSTTMNENTEKVMATTSTGVFVKTQKK